jgi:anaerobic selenocysteine-containing dehydrogenase
MPEGRAQLKAAPYIPADEEPSDEYPFRLTTGRTAYHFHTRTKTARAPALQHAAPDAWAELSASDADRLGVTEGDVVRITSPRGEVRVAARVGNGRDGVVFVPFHYGWWQDPDADEPINPHTANELTITEWDPVSKQPIYKVAAARVERIGPGDGPAPAPTTTASRPAEESAVPPTRSAPVAVVVTSDGEDS